MKKSCKRPVERDVGRFDQSGVLQKVLDAVTKSAKFIECAIKRTDFGSVYSVVIKAMLEARLRIGYGHLWRSHTGIILAGSIFLAGHEALDGFLYSFESLVLSPEPLNLQMSRR